MYCRIVTLSHFEYSQFPKGGAILSILAFQRSQFLQSFCTSENTLLTHTNSLCVISKCFNKINKIKKGGGGEIYYLFLLKSSGESAFYVCIMRIIDLKQESKYLSV